MYTTVEHAEHLRKIRDGGVATGVRIIVPRDACPVCQYYEGGYKFDEEAERPIPVIPFEGCSCAGGCRAFYTPILDLRGP